VNASLSPDTTITVGNGNDTILVGRDNTVTVGTGHDSFIFEQTTPGNIGAVTVKTSTQTRTSSPSQPS
jgi:hypothetical protein